MNLYRRFTNGQCFLTKFVISTSVCAGIRSSSSSGITTDAVEGEDEVEGDEDCAAAGLWLACSSAHGAVQGKKECVAAGLWLAGSSAHGGLCLCGLPTGRFAGFCGLLYLSKKPAQVQSK